MQLPDQYDVLVVGADTQHVRLEQADSPTLSDPFAEVVSLGVPEEAVNRRIEQALVGEASRGTLGSPPGARQRV